MLCKANAMQSDRRSGADCPLSPQLYQPMLSHVIPNHFTPFHTILNTFAWEEPEEDG